jgi:hypothetical protein
METKPTLWELMQPENVERQKQEAMAQWVDSWTPEDYLNNVKDPRRLKRDKMDELLDGIDNALWAGKFEWLARVLDLVNPPEWEVSLQLAFITFINRGALAQETRPGVPPLLEARKNLLNRVEQYLIQTRPADVDALLWNLK